MTSKAKAIWAQFVSGFLGVCGMIALMPDSITNQIAQPFPEAYRGYIGISLLVVTWIGRTYAVKHAAKSAQ